MTNKAQSGSPWSQDEDDVILQCHSATEAAEMLPGRTPGGVRHRLVILRKRGHDKRFENPHLSPPWTRDEDEIVVSDRPLLEIAQLVGRSIDAVKSRRKYVAGSVDTPIDKGVLTFLDDLKRLEKPPTNVAVRDRQPLAYNPSLFTGSGCSSSAAMTAEAGE